MKVSLNWLKELVKISVSDEKLAELLNSRIQGGVREVTEDHIELDLKGYNRPDLLSLRGVAYEVAALTDSEVSFTESEESSYRWVTQKLSETPVEVEALDLAPLYCIAKIEGLKVAPSEKDWAKKLASSGMRAINNVADVTNLVMLEYGQPLHAFDASRVKDQTLVVRTAGVGEELETLDHKKRVLEPVDLVIADTEKAVGLAGVMGGKDSEISDSTTTIFLEAAIFDPTSIRRTAGRLALPSEASRRFQHGLTKKRLFEALEAAIKMYEGLGGTLTAVTIIDNLKEEPRNILVSEEKLRSLVGADIDSAYIKSALEKLHFQVAEPVQGDALHGKVTPCVNVKPPYWRLDIEIEADVVEEVARMYGYENIKAKELVGKMPEKVDQSLFELIYSLKKALADSGLDEVQTYSFFPTQILKNFEIPTERLIKIANPMSVETEYLRNSIMPNLVEKVAENLKNMSEVGIFEIGKVYIPGESGPEEKYVLSAALSDGTDNPLKTLHVIWQKAAKALNLNITLQENGQDGRERLVFHPTRFLKMNSGAMGEAHPRIINRFGIDKRVAVFEIDITEFV